MQELFHFLGAIVAASVAGFIFQVSIIIGLIACILAITFLLVKSELE